MTSVKPKKISDDTVTLIESMVRRCMNELKKKQYELGITKADVDYAVKVTRAVRRATGGATYAGANVIQINLSYWQHRSEKAYHKEYDSFDKDPVIGGVVTYNMNDGRKTFVARKRRAQKQAGDAKKGGNRTKGKTPTNSKTGA